MSKKNEKYESTLWYRLKYWVNGEEEDGIVEKETDKYEAHLKRVSVEDRVYRAFSEIPNDGEEERAHYEELRKELLELSKRYETWPEKRGVKIFNRIYQVAAVILCVFIIGILLVTVSYLPEFGNKDNPSNNEVSERYIEKGLEETGATNIVTGMILDYRAFDTLGESHVLFIGACAVLILLRVDQVKKENQTKEEIEEANTEEIYEKDEDTILKKVAFFLVPTIMLFGIYVILNGHLSPGGGFSGGAIIGAGLILYVNAFGYKKIQRFFTYKTFSRISIVSLLCYACTKGYSFYTGANHLESIVPLGTPGAILSGGFILLLNICVGMVVACTMYAFYTLFRKGGM